MSPEMHPHDPEVHRRAAERHAPPIAEPAPARDVERAPTAETHETPKEIDQ
jgi:hypothetical protein